MGVLRYRPTSNFIELNENECCEIEDAEYHTSWNWLMPVIKRIRDHVNVDMGFEEFDDWRENFKQIDPYNYSKEQCHQAVIKFIKWYNENT